MNEERFTLHASVHILFVKDNKILLLLRKNTTSDGLYGLVAGHVDEGETITSAFIREVKEEVGIDLTPEDIKISTICHSKSKQYNREYIQFYAICNDWVGDFVNKEPDKCGDLKFFPLNELPDNVVLYIKDAIGKVLKGVSFYEYGWKEEEI